MRPLIQDSGSDSTLWGLGADLGLERFFTDSWALRVGAGFHYFHADGDTLRTIGVNWGIAAYF